MAISERRYDISILNISTVFLEDVDRNQANQRASDIIFSE
jgi:hypothetical protein